MDLKYVILFESKIMATNFFKEFKINQKGATALLIVILVLSGFLLITLSAADIVRSGLKLSKTQMESTKAYFAAESGAERILYKIRKGGIDPGDGTSGYCAATPARFCFDADPGVFVSCIAGICPGSEIQTFPFNLAYYKIGFKYVGVSPFGTTTLTSVGSIGDVNRVIEVSY